MTSEELYQFNTIEKKYNLNEAKYRDFDFWNYIRVELIWKYDSLLKNYGQSHITPKFSLKKKIELVFLKIKNIISKGRVGRANRDILVLNHSRRVKCDEFYDCIYTSDFLSCFGSSVLVAEELYNQMHYYPIRERDIVFDDIVYFYDIWEELLLKLNKNKIEEAIISLLIDPINELNCILGCNMEVSDVMTLIQHKYCMYRAQKRFYTSLLNKVMPKVIIEVIGYSCRCMVVNELAKQRGIPIIELQHGSIDNCHEAYNFAEGVVINQFPDYFFLFADFWKKLEIRMPIVDEKRIVVGFPYLEKMKKKYSNINNVKERKKILFLSNGVVGDRMSKLACKLNDALLDIEIIYKLHPGEYADWKQRYFELANSEIEVIDNNVIELYSLLAVADYIISCMGSTTIFEALIFDKPVFVYNFDLPEATVNLNKNGNITIFDNTEELIELLQNEGSTNVAVAFWPDDSIKMMKSQINVIMNGNM